MYINYKDFKYKDFVNGELIINFKEEFESIRLTTKDFVYYFNNLTDRIFVNFMILDDYTIVLRCERPFDGRVECMSH